MQTGAMDAPTFADIPSGYRVHEWRNAIAVLSTAHPNEWSDLLACLDAFWFRRSELLVGGGQKSVIAGRLDSFLSARGWREKKFNTRIVVDETEYDTPTHKIDCFKGRVALEIEWNNKDPFFDRDLNNFRLLYDLRAIDVGVIITRSSELQDLFRSLGRNVAQKYGASTTHWNKLFPRIEGGGGGGCPILIFGILADRFIEDEGSLLECSVEGAHDGDD